MRYLIVDAELNGTGIRDKYDSGFILPEKLGLSFETITKLKEWLLSYEVEHFNGFMDNEVVDALDCAGKEIALIIKKELGEVKMEYYSDAKMKSYLI